MIKEEKNYKYPSKDEIKKMCNQVLKQENKEDIIEMIKYLKNR